MNRLAERYKSEVVMALRNEFGYTNVMAIPKIERIVVNMGLGEATQNSKLIEVGTEELTKITGQHPVTRRPRRSIPQIKLRQRDAIATMVTQRNKRIYQ